MAKKERADQLVYMAGLAESREQAKRLVMAGQVYRLVPGGCAVRVEKPGQQFAVDSEFSLEGKDPYVSRGAYKLLTAMEYFSIDATDFVCLDAGASTGGFTDCLLQHGASRVYAVDVGKNQLHEKLREDPRVISMEGVNLRHAPLNLLPEPVDIIVSDVSFISLTLVLPSCVRWLKADGMVAALIKPQFELGPGKTEKGVVRDEALRQEAIHKVTAFCEHTLGLHLEGIVPSAIRGPKGNQEYMALWRRTEGHAGGQA